MGFRQAKGIYSNLDKSTSENGVELSISEELQTTELLLDKSQKEQSEEEISLEVLKNTTKISEEDVKTVTTTTVATTTTKPKKVTVPKEKS